VLFVFSAIYAGLGLYGLIYLATGICAPKWFLDNVAVNHIDRRYSSKSKMRNVFAPKPPWYSMPVTLLTMIALGVVIHASCYPVTQIIPETWGGHGEDGEWTSTADFLRFSAAFIGSIGVATAIEKNADRLDQSNAKSNEE
jgi:hypothetical protein